MKYHIAILKAGGSTSVRFNGVIVNFATPSNDARTIGCVVLLNVAASPGGQLSLALNCLGINLTFSSKPSLSQQKPNKNAYVWIGSTFLVTGVSKVTKLTPRSFCVHGNPQ